MSPKACVTAHTCFALDSSRFFGAKRRRSGAMPSKLPNIFQSERHFSPRTPPIHAIWQSNREGIAVGRVRSALERFPSLHAAGTGPLARLDRAWSLGPEGPRKRRFPGARLFSRARYIKQCQVKSARKPQTCSQSRRMRRSFGARARSLRVSFWNRTCMVPADTPSLRAISESEAPSM